MRKLNKAPQDDHFSINILLSAMGPVLLSFITLKIKIIMLKSKSDASKQLKYKSLSN